MKNWLILTMMKSKKFWYAVSSIVIPMLVQYLGVDETTASNLFYACLTLVVGQGIADSARK
jgi:hypothetical protein